MSARMNIGQLFAICLYPTTKTLGVWLIPITTPNRFDKPHLLGFYLLQKLHYRGAYQHHITLGRSRNFGISYLIFTRIKRVYISFLVEFCEVCGQSWREIDLDLFGSSCRRNFRIYFS